MRRFIFLAVVILSIVSGCTEAPGSGPPDKTFALKRELTPQDLDGFHASFTPAVSADYAITLNFRQPIEVEEVRDLVNGAPRSDDAQARFDFVWQVLDGGKPITGGTGQQGATGILDTGSGGGGGDPKSRALVFGTFSGEANRLYSIEFKAGPAMAPIIRAKPQLEIVRVSAIRQ
ncbi:MAG TPA: hypothetical protein VH702_21760 [Vicinamibacterales bacterium]|jgi:hypothetical protein